MANTAPLLARPIAAARTVVSTVIEFITPEIAQQYLDKRVPPGRPVKRTRVMQYARDMLRNQWGPSHQGIAFDRNGAFIDGQHRMLAIIESGKTIQMHVTRGLDPLAVFTVDQGIPRNVLDNRRIAGHSTTNAEIAVARAMLTGLRVSRTMTPTDVVQFLDAHAESIAFSVKVFGSRKRGLISAPIMAPVARAWYTQDHAKLERFGEVVSLGLGDEVLDRGALLLRSWLVDTARGVARISAAKGASNPGQQTVALVRYAKTERALAAFLGGELISRLYATEEELFPLPEEQQGALL